MLGFSPLSAAPLADDGGAINYEFTTVSITTGAPSVDAPQITQNHQLTSVSITTGAPSVDAPEITQNHQLTSVSITTGAPVVDSPNAPQNYSLTSTDITSGAPLVGELYTVNNYTATASGLFDSVAENQSDIFSGNKKKTNYQHGETWERTQYVNNVSVNSTGISFTATGIKRFTSYITNTTTVSYVSNAITLNWSGTTAMTVGTTSTSSSAPSSSGRYDITTTTGLQNFKSAITTAIGNANLGNTVYDWIPSEVEVYNGSTSDSSFHARVTGQSTSQDNYQFIDDSPSVGAGLLTNSESARSTAGFVDTSNSSGANPSGQVLYFTVGDRFLFGTYGANPYSTNLDTNSTKNAETGYAAVRFDRAVQTNQVRGALIQVSEAFPTEEITTGAPIVDAPILTQNYNLSGVAITIGAPSVDQSSLSITVNLASTAITTSAPVVDTTDLEQNHALQPSEITSGAPVVDTTDINQNHVLTGAITVAAPVVDQPVISQHFDLTTNSITTGAPIIDAATVGVTHNLTSSEVTSGAPVIDTTNLSQVYNLQPALTIGSPIIDAAGITQNHVLSSVSITTGAPVIDRPGDNWTTIILPLDGTNFWTEQTASIPSVDNFWTEAA